MNMANIIDFGAKKDEKIKKEEEKKKRQLWRGF